jgi:hypothetical protein
MSEKTTCEACRELFPLLFARALSEKEEASVREHLADCPECRDLLAKEKGLMNAATTGGRFSPLADHPASDLLDSYVHAREHLSSTQLAGIEGHLAQCDLCSEVTARLSELPTNLDDLVTDTELPLITGLDRKLHQKGSIVDIGRRVFWHPLAGYAAAAMILLAAILSYQSPGPQLLGVINGTIPSTGRGTETVTVFESPGRQCYLDLKYYVNPESGHQYDIEIRSQERGPLSQSIRDYRDFDPQGNATVRVLLEAGQYRLIICDIEGGDTIRIAKPLELRTR